MWENDFLFLSNTFFIFYETPPSPSSSQSFFILLRVLCFCFRPIFFFKSSLHINTHTHTFIISLFAALATHSLSSCLIWGWIFLSVLPLTLKQIHSRLLCSPLPFSLFPNQMITLPQSHSPNLATNWVSSVINSITAFILEFNVP